MNDDKVTLYEYWDSKATMTYTTTTSNYVITSCTYTTPIMYFGNSIFDPNYWTTADYEKKFNSLPDTWKCRHCGRPKSDHSNNYQLPAIIEGQGYGASIKLNWHIYEGITNLEHLEQKYVESQEVREECCSKPI